MVQETTGPLQQFSRDASADNGISLVFISYSHKDEELRYELDMHLSNLKSQNLVRSWHDQKVTAGTDWLKQIDVHLESARVILLLVSPDFMASHYCYGIEMKRALERHAAGTARVIPVLLRPVDWDGAPFAKLQALPKNARFVTLWRNRDAAFLDVVRGIRAAINELTRESRPAGRPAQADGTPSSAESGPLRSDRVILEVVVKPRDSSESREVLEQRAVRIIREAVPEVEVIWVREGSIILTLSLTQKEGERLCHLIRSGVLEIDKSTIYINDDIDYNINSLIELLWSDNESARQAAAEVLGAIGPEARDAVPKLIDTLWDGDPSVRQSAAEALGKIGPDTRDAVPYLITSLKDRSGPDRRTAAEALGNIRSPEAVAPLAELRRDTDPGVRGRAGETLGFIGTPRATTKLNPLPGLDAVRWYIWRKYRHPRFLFRGENRDWGSTYSSLDRLQAKKVIPQTQWSTFDERLLTVVEVLDIVLNARPVFPTPHQVMAYRGPASLYAPNQQLAPEALVYATLQHYGLPSPFVDLSGNLETALFFCSYPPAPDDATALLFVVDTEAEAIDKRLARMPNIDLYRTSRHARQDAHGLCLRLGDGERDVDYRNGEDFRKLDGVLELITFPWLKEERAEFYQQHKRCLLSVSSDRLAMEVHTACEHGLDQAAFDAIRVDEIFRRVQDGLLDNRLGSPSYPGVNSEDPTVW
jgi:hypothetical protein